jgi:N-methylhydantoinase A
VVNARAAAIGIADKAELRPSATAGGVDDALRLRRPVLFEETGEFVDTPVYDRTLLGAGATFEGPAVLEQSDTTILVPPGARGRVDEYLSIVIETGGVQPVAVGSRNGHAVVAKGA